MKKELFCNRLCYDRSQMIEQSKHYQRLLEAKTSFDMKPPKPKRKILLNTSSQLSEIKV